MAAAMEEVMAAVVVADFTVVVGGIPVDFPDAHLPAGFPAIVGFPAAFPDILHLPAGFPAAGDPPVDLLVAAEHPVA